MGTSAQECTEIPVPHHWTLDEYHRAIDGEVFTDDFHIELLHGELFDMPPISEPHIGAVGYLTWLFFTQLGWQRASSQTPIILPSDGEPEPDVAVRELGAPSKPTVAQVQLVIEVSQTSRRRDLGSKLEDYLRDGLRELWIIDLVEQCALIYRNGQLVARHPRGVGARLSAELVPEVTVELDQVFEAARLPNA